MDITYHEYIISVYHEYHISWISISRPEYFVNEYYKQERWQRAPLSESNANTDCAWFNARNVKALLSVYRESRKNSFPTTFRLFSKSLPSWNTRDTKMIYDTATSVLVSCLSPDKQQNCAMHYCASIFFKVFTSVTAVAPDFLARWYLSIHCGIASISQPWKSSCSSSLETASFNKCVLRWPHQQPSDHSSL